MIMKKKGRCWKGYKPVPGKKPYSKGSCAPVSDSINRIGELLSEKVMPDTAIKMKAARKAMGKKAGKLLAKSKKETAPGEGRFLAAQAVNAIKAGQTAKEKQKFAHDVEKYKRKEPVEDSIQRIGDLITEVAAWQKKAGKNPSGGLNKKGVESYRRENPGSKLKTAVTTKPSKLKKGSKAAKRRKSFCARMGGMKKRLTSKKTASNPDSRINKALRKWNC